jgi:peptide deformylase
MIKPIIAYGDPILRLKAQKINFSEIENIKSLINDMWDTMYNAKGVGLAAPQIGISKSIFIADFSFFKDEKNFNENELINMKQVFINPKITQESGLDFVYSEGCLSIPNITEDIKRKEKLKINFLNEMFEPKQMKCSGIIARVIQHEYDHLKGVLFVDKLSQSSFNLIKDDLLDISTGNIDLKYKMKFYK